MSAKSARRIRSGLRRTALVRRPAAIRRIFPVEDLRFTEGNRITLYDSGAEGLAAMLAAILAGTRRIHLETYLFRQDATGQRFLSGLIDRARSGVEVRLLYDAVGSRGTPDAFFRPLREAGGEVLVFNPLSGLLQFNPRRRDHRKILVVDGRIAFTGGLNIGDEYDLGLGARGGWRDTHVRVEGPAVRDLEAVFLESWFRSDGPDLEWASLLASTPPPCGNVRCAVVPDGPVYRRRRMRDLLIAALDNSTRYARLESPYFAPGRRVLEAMTRTGERSVQVDLIVAGPRSDHPILRRAARAILPRLLERGIRVWEYEAQMMHAKVGFFDDDWAIVGTSNLDRQSFDHSFEVNLVFEGPEIPARLSQRFELDRSLSYPVDHATLAARGWTDRLLDRLASFVLLLI